ncbi:DEAD/DEAH box helicase [Saccharomonospora xinjiangensis]|uniref:RNA helicase n=1 Tax=Saccharomonospora xinjiangensis XJ-54 TaxID=882086 RepID=I0V5W5_9PSEU|nr:DEAD/DEAH box helicase [Saccharomonospora xinjiangensis]EID55518.1 DNA/RNA helicase, superfamily II [Saccharomonospora xinjiangensis XJ-54]
MVASTAHSHNVTEVATDPSIDTDTDTGTAADSGPATEFGTLGLRPELLRALSDLGYEEPTPIQMAAIPALLDGADVVGQAATGTGKTAAFSLPVLHRLADLDRNGKPSALVLVPTRELAAQVCEAMYRYGRHLGIRVVPVYGGQPMGRQLRSLETGVDVVVATPGRALDHLSRGSLDLSKLRMVVLDEADEMLDMGFAEDIDAILDQTPTDRQTMLFSATMPPRISGMVRRYLREPRRIELTRAESMSGDAAAVTQVAYVVPRGHKPAALGRVLDIEAPEATVVFCRTREEVDRLTEIMNGRGYRAEALHGGMDQSQRNRVVGRLRAGTADLVVATDVAARGLDIDQLTHVVNYDVPSAPEIYVHRIGRVGRAGREGSAITLAEPREHRMIKTIERVTGQTISVRKLPTVADLRARRLELTRVALREALVEAGDLDRYRVVVEPLAEEFDIVEIALAAVKLAHGADGTDGDAEIPDVELRPRDDGRSRRGPKDRGPRDTRRGKRPSGGMTRLFVSLGRRAGVRPQDLVGAIAGESQLRGKDVGAIEITDKFSLVDVPESAADDVITALRDSSIKGRKVVVRRERFASR